MVQSNVFRINMDNKSYYPFELSLARGLVPNHDLMHKYGRCLMPTANTETDCWSGASTGFLTYPYPTSAVALEVASTSANDTAAGTGARTLLIYGLDENYDEVQMLVTLNGQTPVSVSQTCIRVFRALVLEVGSVGTNVGDIWIADAATTWTAGVPATNTYKLAHIAAGHGQTETALYTVPAGYTGYFTRTTTSMFAALNRTSLTRYYVRNYNEDSTNNYNSWRNLGELALSSSSDCMETYEIGEPIMTPEKSDFRVTVESSTTSSEMNVRYNFILVKNDE